MLALILLKVIDNLVSGWTGGLCGEEVLCCGITFQRDAAGACDSYSLFTRWDNAVC